MKKFGVSLAVFVVLGPLLFGVFQSFFDLGANSAWTTLRLSLTLGVIVGYVFGLPLAVLLSVACVRLSPPWFFTKMAGLSLVGGALCYALLSYQRVWEFVYGLSTGLGDFVYWGLAIAVAVMISSLVCAALVRAINQKWRPW